MQKTMRDFEEVYNFLTRDDRLADISDDSNPSMFAVTKKILSQDIVLMPSPGTCFVLSPITTTTFATHFMTTKGERKKMYVNTLSALEWVSSNTLARVLVSFVPSVYNAAIHYANRIGLRKVGILPEGFLKNGKHEDIIIMSASVDDVRKELLCRQQ